MNFAVLLSFEFGKGSGGNSGSHAVDDLRFEIGGRCPIWRDIGNGDGHHDTIGIFSGCFKQSGTNKIISESTVRTQKCLLTK